MARRKKSALDIQDQLNRIGYNIMKGGTALSKSPRWTKAQNTGLRYIANIRKAQGYNSKMDEAYSRLANAERQGKNGLKDYNRTLDRLDNTKYSRSTYMGLAGSKG